MSAAAILGVDEARWAAVRAEWAARCAPGDDPSTRLRILAEVWGAPVVCEGPPASCPICGSVTAPALARGAMVVGRCGACGHGALLSGAAPPTVYDSVYYTRRDAGGAGYDGYEGERAYREAKGARLLDWIVARAGRPIASLLEVGSGFGFTRAAAHERGWTSAGVDPNPAAADGARRLYGMETITATLEGAAIPGPFDLVLYQFVLEHLADPVAELARAARVVAPSGCLALFVPSMEAVEVEVFGASYRSLRADHLHLFSRRSITRCLGDAGLRVVALDSECNLHLLGGFLTDEELREVYASGRGPDLRVLAERDG